MDKLSSVEAVFILKKQQASRSIRSTELNLSFDYQVSHSDIKAISEELSLSCLVAQHRKEMLDRRFNLKQAVKETLDSQFEKMLLSCVFVPLLHREVSLSSVIPKPDEDEENVPTSIEDVELAITIRQKLVREEEKRRRSQGETEADHAQILEAIEESHREKINRFEYVPRRQSQDSMLR